MSKKDDILEKQEVIEEILNLYEYLYDTTRNDLEDLSIEELDDLLIDLNMKSPIVLSIKDEVNNQNLEELSVEELLDLQKRIEEE